MENEGYRAVAFEVGGELENALARIRELEAQLREEESARIDGETEFLAEEKSMREQLILSVNIQVELRAQVARLEAALEFVEWGGSTYDGKRYCLWCLRVEDDGHSIACIRQAALAPEPEGGTNG